MNNMPEVIEQAKKDAEPSYAELRDKLANREIELQAMRNAANSFKALYEKALEEKQELISALKEVGKCQVCVYRFTNPDAEPCVNCRKLNNWKCWGNNESFENDGEKDRK